MFLSIRMPCPWLLDLLHHSSETLRPNPNSAIQHLEHKLDDTAWWLTPRGGTNSASITSSDIFWLGGCAVLSPNQLPYQPGKTVSA